MKRTTSMFAAVAATLLASASAWAADAIVTGDVILRAGPDPEYPAVADLPEGTAVSVQGCVGNYAWCDVAARGERGWVAGEFLVNMYQGRRVVIREYGVRIGIPVVSFSFVSYWDSHYRSRPFYVERTRYARITPRVDVNVNVNTTSNSSSKSTSGTATTSGTTTSTTSGTATTTERARTPASDTTTSVRTVTAEKEAARTESAKRATAAAGSTSAVEQDSSPQRAVKSDTAKPEPGQASAKREDETSAIEPGGERPAQARAKPQESRGQSARPEDKAKQDKPARKDKDEKDNPDDAE